MRLILHLERKALLRILRAQKQIHQKGIQIFIWEEIELDLTLALMGP